MHSHKLVTEYFPKASHQVVLLSTDEEIDENNASLLAPHVGRSYTLEFIDEDERSEIRPGYFWEVAP